MHLEQQEPSSSSGTSRCWQGWHSRYPTFFTELQNTSLRQERFCIGKENLNLADTFLRLFRFRLIEVLIVRFLTEQRRTADDGGSVGREETRFYKVLVEICDYTAVFTAVKGIQSIDRTHGIEGSVIRPVQRSGILPAFHKTDGKRQIPFRFSKRYFDRTSMRLSTALHLLFEYSDRKEVHRPIP